MKINEHGFWECNNNDNHMFDPILCNSIIAFIKHENCKAVVDIGCGHGLYTKEINAAGIYCDGFDGNPNTPKLTDGQCLVTDFSIPQKFPLKYDYALCLEVAEHIPPEYESVFIKNLIECGNEGIILSWAIPGQGGHGHFNERDNKYVIDLITNKGYKYNSDHTNLLRGMVNLPWFKNTLLIFQKV